MVTFGDEAFESSRVERHRLSIVGVMEREARVFSRRRVRPCWAGCNVRVFVGKVRCKVEVKKGRNESYSQPSFRVGELEIALAVQIRFNTWAQPEGK
jgi:hypothetical protein